MAQILEISRDSAKALALAQKTDATIQKEDVVIRQIASLLSPIGVPQIELTLSISCQTKYCDQEADAFDVEMPSVDIYRNHKQYEDMSSNTNKPDIAIRVNSLKLERHSYGDMTPLRNPWPQEILALSHGITQWACLIFLTPNASCTYASHIHQGLHPDSKAIITPTRLAIVMASGKMFTCDVLHEERRGDLMSDAGATFVGSVREYIPPPHPDEQFRRD